MPRLLWLFCLVNLVIGTGAFVLGGILVPLARDLAISVPMAGQAMTAYALSTALLAPMVLMATGRWSRKHALLLALLLFAAGNVLCALANSLSALLVGRMLMGLGAVFTPIAAGIALATVAPARRGKALAFVFLGVSLSYVIGVPLGAWLGQAHGWQLPIWWVVALCGLAIGAVARWVPSNVQAPGASFAGLGHLLARGDVLGVLATTLLYFVAIFAVFSYIGPVLQALSPMSGERMSVTLSLFGTADWSTGNYGAFTMHHLWRAIVRANMSGFLLRVEAPLRPDETVAAAQARCSAFLAAVVPLARKALR